MSYKDKNVQRAWQLAKYHKIREFWLREHGPCVRCKSWDDLEIDHVDPAKKVSHRVWSWSKEKREAELAKCQVLCAECHKKKTADQLYRAIRHGTKRGYRRLCRCDLCRAAHIEEMRVYHLVHPR